ncbi:MAG TPA: cytochrome c3 family protein [Acidobacteriota bacterium]|nr:cytochrome c3 family protein [Acidobacteriota bacterium]
MIKQLFFFCTAGALLAATGIALTVNAPSFTADRHGALGLGCDSCHKEASFETVSQDACLSCHESLGAVAAGATDFFPDPHKNHITKKNEVTCLQCHQGHKADVSLCHQCHEGILFRRQ